MSNRTGENAKALRTLVLAADYYRQAVATALGLGPTDATAMSQLRAAGEMNARELATRLGLTPSAVTAVLGRLERAGLAERIRHPTDRRQIVVCLTEDGVATLDRSEHWLNDVLEFMDCRPDATNEVLSSLASALQKQSDLVREEAENS